MDILLFPDVYKSEKIDSGEVFYSFSLVLGLDEYDKVIFNTNDPRDEIQSQFLKILLTRKGSVVTSPLEGTALLSYVSSPMDEESFESAAIACILDAEQQVRSAYRPSKAIDILRNPSTISLSTASVLSTDYISGLVSIQLVFSDGTTSKVTLAGKINA